VNAETADAVRGLLRAFMRNWLDAAPEPAEQAQYLRRLRPFRSVRER
jgi:hypothetical protein